MHKKTWKKHVNMHKTKFLWEAFCLIVSLLQLTKLIIANFIQNPPPQPQQQAYTRRIFDIMGHPEKPLEGKENKELLFMECWDFSLLLCSLSVFQRYSKAKGFTAEESQSVGLQKRIHKDQNFWKSVKQSVMLCWLLQCALPYIPSPPFPQLSLHIPTPKVVCLPFLTSESQTKTKKTKHLQCQALQERNFAGLYSRFSCRGVLSTSAANWDILHLCACILLL